MKENHWRLQSTFIYLSYIKSELLCESSGTSSVANVKKKKSCKFLSENWMMSNSAENLFLNVY